MLRQNLPATEEAHALHRVLTAFLTLVLCAGWAIAQPLPAARAADTANLVTVENRKSGTTRWQIPWAGHQIADDSAGQIKGYASATSVNIGGRIDIKTSAASRGSATWNAYRLGWYHGQGGRHMASGSFEAGPQASCPMSPATGELACSWGTSFSLNVPSSWVSGQYVVVLTKGGFQNYVVFTVRDDSRTAEMLLVQPVNTYQAYNNYPNNRTPGSKSLYTFNSHGDNTVGGTPAAVKVSFDRPYANHGAGHLFTEDSLSARYYESRGVDLKYATNVDLQTNPGGVQGVRAIVFAGHDEYWTGEQFDLAESARDAGTSLAFLGANDVFWQIRYENAHRTVVCYRRADVDPVTDPSRETILFRDTGRPEQPLIGVMWPPTRGMLGQPAPWVVSNPGHWFYRGTRAVEGTQIPWMVGVEADRRVAEFPSPAGSDWTLLARSPFTVRNSGTQGIHEATMYQSPSGAYVFGAGTISYGVGLGDFSKADARAQTMTGNLTARMTGADLTVDTARYAGPDRYQTAAAVSAATFPAAFGGTVYLAIGTNYPDALGAAAATQGQGPVLLVKGGELPDATVSELLRLRPRRIVAVGSAGVLPESVLTEVAEVTGVTPERVAGPDRYLTAAAISADRFAPGVPVAYVATGQNFPDALAAGAAGAQMGGPVLLSRQNILPAATRDELVRLRPGRIVVAGSSGVVSDALVAEISKIAPTVRVAGSTRYETSLALMRDTRSRGGQGVVALATGRGFADALAAGPMIGARGGSLVLLPSGPELTVASAEEIVRHDPALLVAIGSDAVTPDTVMQEAMRLFDVVDGEPMPVAPAANSPAAQPLPSEVPGREPAHDIPTVEDYEQSTRLPWLEDN